VKVAIFIPSGYSVSAFELRSILRFFQAESIAPLFLVDMETPEGQTLQRWGLPTLSTRELRAALPRWQRIWSYLSGVTEKELLIRSCDAGVLFLGASHKEYDLLLALESFGKTVFTVDTSNLMVRRL